MTAKKKKRKLRKLTLTATVRTKIPIKVAGKTIMVDGDAEFPINLIFDKDKHVGVLTAEELKKYENERGKLEVLKAELKKKQKENRLQLDELVKSTKESVAKAESGESEENGENRS